MTRTAMLLLFVLLFVGCGKAPQHAATGTAPRTESGTVAPRKAMLEVRLELSADVTSTDDAAKLARDLESKTTSLGGWVESSSIGSGGSHLVLRVPTDQLETVRAVLASRGPLAHESRSAKDVTDAVMDLDARVKTAKVEEARLLELLQNKTGNLADVLAVEKALSEVRERIERMETEQRAAHARVDLAVVDVSLNLRGSLEGGPVGQRFLVAGREGLAAAREAVILTGTTALRAGPTLLLLGGLVALVLRAVRRFRRAAS